MWPLKSLAILGFIGKINRDMNQKNSITSKTILGILGSGQLARMTALAASELGIETRIYCSESETSPAEHVASKTTKGQINDVESILSFCQNCDYVTLENEFIELGILEAIDARFPNRLFPNAKTFALIGDKISEKNAFIKAGLTVAPFKKVTSSDDILEFSKTHGFPLVLKTAKGGYDGYGNATIKSADQINAALSKFSRELLVEAFIPYVKELAVLVARNSRGEMEIYPVAHTMQENHICHYVSVPADINKSVEAEIKKMASTAMTAIDAVGIFAFEFFLTDQGHLYLNESAPRPHNSGHYSIEGCVSSQFENHVRSVLNLPLGSSELRAPHIVMLNLLGTKNAPAELSNSQEFLAVKDGHLHLYGKKMSKVGRKMGHFTLLGNSTEEIFKILEKLKSEYQL